MPLSQISLLSVLKAYYQNDDANQMFSGKKAACAFLNSPGSKRNTSISTEIQKGVIFKSTRSTLPIHMCRHVSCGSQSGGWEWGLLANTEIHAGSFGQNLKIGSHLETLDADGIILKWFWKIFGWRVSIRFVRFNKSIGRRLLQTQQPNFVFRKCKELV
jgi:hypothetical protein